MPRNVLLTYTPVEGVTQSIPDLGLAFLATSLRRDGHAVRILDYKLDAESLDGFEAIAAGGYDVFGIKTFTRDFECTREMMARIRKVAPEALIVAGGPHASGCPNRVLTDYPDADFAIAGEGEESFRCLLEAVDTHGKESEAVRRVPGLVYRRDGNTHVTPQQCNDQLDPLGIPAWDLVDPRRYDGMENLWVFNERQRVVAPLSVVRGCPYTCKFCSAHTIMGRTPRFRSIPLVMRELRMLHDEYGVREFHIVDDFFAADRNYALEFCEALRREGLGMTWCLPMGIRMDAVSRKLLRALEDAGCYGASLGLECGSQRVLEFIGKRMTVDLARERVLLIKDETRWLLHGFFMLGLPTETRAEIEATIAFADSLPLDSASFSIFRLHEGTELHGWVRENGALSPEEFDRLEGEEMGFAPEGMTPEEVVALRRKAYLRFYSRPGRMARLLGHSASPRKLRTLYRRMRVRLRGAAALSRAAAG